MLCLLDWLLTREYDHVSNSRSVRIRAAEQPPARDRKSEEDKHAVMSCYENLSRRVRWALREPNADLADTIGEAQASKCLGQAQDGEQRARRGVAVGHLRLGLLLPHLRIHRRHILCTSSLQSAHSSDITCPASQASMLTALPAASIGWWFTIACSKLRGRATCEVFREEGVVGLGSSDIGAQELRAERGLPLCGGRCVALLVH